MDYITKYIEGEAIEFHRSTDKDAPGWTTTIGGVTFRLRKVVGSHWWAFKDGEAIVGAKTMTKAVAKLLARRDRGQL